jgi:hypothetical protein
MIEQRSSIVFPLLILILSLLWGVSPAIHAAEVSANEAVKITFEDHVLPVFKARCMKCHAGAEPAAGLRLTTRREILRGGESGPAMRIAAAESSCCGRSLRPTKCPKVARR